MTTRRPFRAALLLSLVAAAAASGAAQVTDKDLLNPDPNDFLLYSGTYDSQRHSLLKEINTEQRRDRCRQSGCSISPVPRISRGRRWSTRA